MSNMKTVFTYHAMDRVAERFPTLSKMEVNEVISDVNEWNMTMFDTLSGSNKGDGVKLKTTIRVDGKILKVVLIKKVEQGRPTLIILSIHP